MKTKGWIDRHQSWTEQILKVVEQHPAIQFIWVNYQGNNLPNLPNLFSKNEKEKTSRIFNSNIQIATNSGHLPHLEEPELVAEAWETLK